MVVHLISPDQRYDGLYLSNYATLRVRDELARIKGVGEARAVGAGEYAMRVWLDPDKVAALNLTASDVVRAIREQNVQVAAGQLGAPPAPNAAEFQLLIDTRGRLVTEDEFANIVVKTGDAGQITRLRDVARVELGVEQLRAARIARRQARRGARRSSSCRAAMRSRSPTTCAPKMAELAKGFPGGRDVRDRLRPDRVRAPVDRRRRAHAVRGARARRARSAAVPADVARVDHSARGRARVARRHGGRHACVRLLAERAVAVRPRARDRHRRGRRDRRGRERGAQHRARARSPSPPRSRRCARSRARSSPRRSC